MIFVTPMFVVIYTQNFFKKFMKTKICIFQGISSYFVTRIFRSYIFTNIFWKTFEKNLSDLSKNLWKAIQVIHLINATHILKVIFEAYKKYFLVYTKMVNNY